MPWNIDTSRKRIARNAAAIPEIVISDLKREMTLDKVKLARPKRITGVHSYIALANEQRLIDDLLQVDDHDAAKRAARALNLYQRATGRTADAFGAARIHFQGSRLHSLTYRPFSDPPEIAARAVGMALAVNLVVRDALNPALKDEPDLKVAAGAAYGESLATMSGSRGDSELLFIGDPANDGAKAIDRSCRLRITAGLLDLLDCDDLGIEVTEHPDGRYAIAMSREAIEDLAERFGVDWTLDSATKNVNDDAEAITLDSVGISKAIAEIAKDRLSLANCKLNQALTIFGDLDGFTAIVAAAMGDDGKLAELVRDFHIIRTELRHVAIRDYDPTLRVQYQGDRIQLLRHLPHDDPAKRALQAVKIAAGWNSSLTQTLPEFIDLDNIEIATGIADGPTMISKLGTRGHRDVVTVGAGVRRAERIQRKLDGGEIGVDGATLNLLPDDVQSMFEWRAGAQAHVCTDRDINDIELALRAAAYDAEELQSVTTTATKVAVGAGAALLLGAAVARATRSDAHGSHGQAEGGRGQGSRGDEGSDAIRGSDGHGGGHGGDVVPRRRWAP
jgi:class 3 adenylate cyclase